MYNLIEVLIASIVSSGLIGLLVNNILNRKIEIYKQELNKSMERFSLYEQEKHQVYRDYYKVLMDSQSSARVKLEFVPEYSKRMTKDYVNLNDYLHSNALYFSEEIYEFADELLNDIFELVVLKDEIINSEESLNNQNKLINKEELEKVVADKTTKMKKILIREMTE